MYLVLLFCSVVFAFAFVFVFVFTDKISAFVLFNCLFLISINKSSADFSFGLSEFVISVVISIPDSFFFFGFSAFGSLGGFGSFTFFSFGGFGSLGGFSALGFLTFGAVCA